MGFSINKSSSLFEKLVKIEESLRNEEISFRGLMVLLICEKTSLRLRFDGKEHDIARRRWFVS